MLISPGSVDLKTGVDSMLDKIQNSIHIEIKNQPQPNTAINQGVNFALFLCRFQVFLRSFSTFLLCSISLNFDFLFKKIVFSDFLKKYL